MRASDDPIIIEYSYPASIMKVWSAITDHNEMVQWYFDNIPDFKAEVGFRTQFNIEAPSRDFLHMWKVTEVIEPKRISYEWQFEDCPGMSLSTWELSESSNGTELMLTLATLEDFPDLPEFKEESGREGWAYFLDQRLRGYLASEL